MNSTTTRQNPNAPAQPWPDRTSLMLGIVLAISPWLVPGGSATATWNAVTFGVLVAIVAGAALTSPAPATEQTNVALGLWLLVTPWVLGFANHAAPAWTSVLVGTAVAWCAAFQLLRLKRHQAA